MGILIPFQVILKVTVPLMKRIRHPLKVKHQKAMENFYYIFLTWSDHPTNHCTDRYSPAQITKTLIDFCLSDSWLKQFRIDVRVFNSYLVFW